MYVVDMLENKGKELKSIMISDDTIEQMQQKELYIIHCLYNGLYVVWQWDNKDKKWKEISKTYKRKKNAYNFIVRKIS